MPKLGTPIDMQVFYTDSSRPSVKTISLEEDITELELEALELEERVKLYRITEEERLRRDSIKIYKAQISDLEKQFTPSGFIKNFLLFLFLGFLAFLFVWVIFYIIIFIIIKPIKWTIFGFVDNGKRTIEK